MSSLYGDETVLTLQLEADASGIASCNLPCGLGFDFAKTDNIQDVSDVGKYDSSMAVFLLRSMRMVDDKPRILCQAYCLMQLQLRGLFQ